MATLKRTLCTSCDIFCQVHAEVPSSGGVGDVIIKATDERPWRANLCIKGVHAPQGFSHPNRVLHPLKRVGERGEGKWQQVTWDEALDDIAARLSKIIDEHGPEALAVSASSSNLQTDHGLTRRFMNLLGAPNWISGVSLCMGNTSAVNRMVYGWYPYPDYNQTNCIVLFGHDPKPHSWTSVYNSIRRAQDRGAKLIVVDPRLSESAKRADVWLPLKPGTDAAMCFGWIKVILDEGLYDEDFVERWTVGFDDFRKRVDEFPLERVSQITGVSADLIAQAARMYATSGPSVIPWTPITDQQRNSTSAIRLHCSLRAICGYLDVPGGEVFHGLHPDIVCESDIELHHELPPAKRALQLGADQYPVFTYRGMEPLREPTKRVWGREWVNLIGGNYMAHPSAVFRAMRDGVPYPVKAFFALGNNVLMSYANMRQSYDALMNQDLVVVFEQFRTPTAQLADYILPGDSWLERNALNDSLGWMSVVRPSQKVVEPPGDCRGVLDIWHGLAHRMGLGEHFPWATSEELLDHRLERLGMKYEEFSEKHPYHFPKGDSRKYERTGFATPSGKVELRSGVLEGLGFDPLPYWREGPPPDDRFPLTMFIGVREDEYFQTGHRHITKLRKRNTEPCFFVSPRDAEAAGVHHGDWAEVVTVLGRVKARVEIQPEMPVGVVRVPHGWWQPEREEGDGSLSGAWEFADAQICPDDPDHVDLEQGVPQFKGVACRLQAIQT